jgi:hypothetical protein
VWQRLRQLGEDDSDGWAGARLETGWAGLDGNGSEKLGLLRK